MAFYKRKKLVQQLECVLIGVCLGPAALNYYSVFWPLSHHVSSTTRRGELVLQSDGMLIRNTSASGRLFKDTLETLISFANAYTYVK